MNPLSPADDRAAPAEEPQNVYDDPAFFAGYEKLRRTRTGLNEALEQPALWSVLPDSLDGLDVLDLGCGFGDFARMARARGARSVLAIDVSANMLAAAAERTRDATIEYRRQSIEHFDSAGRAFDLVVSSLALHYVKDYAAVVSRVATLLVPGGRFAFSVEHPICTALPGQQWMRDAGGRPLYWPVDDYRAEGERRTRWFVAGVVKYHRTVETYVTGLLAVGLVLRALKEPGPVAGEVAKGVPDIDLHLRRPPFLVLAADRVRHGSRGSFGGS
ncbi:MAG: class I SAM-dependent methyltransferase [Rhodospirillales bacterium]|nr:class I SAM-dependent methyltransferase [Rhodospirillales bacterium]